MKTKRLVKIEEYIHTKGSATLDELCDYFGVSKNTIRRDINIILQDGSIEKVYGGVKSVVNYGLTSFEHRNIVHATAKERIAQLAAAQIKPGDFIFIDSGTTTRSIIDYLPNDINITVLTNNLDIMNACALHPNIGLLSLGSHYKRETRSFVGLHMEAKLSQYNISKAFMAATAVSIHSGVTNSDLMEHEIKKNLVQIADEIFLLVDDSKFEKATLLTYMPLADVSTVVTNNPIDNTYRDFFEEQQIKLLIAE